MMILLLAGLLSHHGPAPVSGLYAVREADGTVTLNWILPSDPSVVGITIDRFRFDEGHHDLDIIEIVGLTGTYHDTSAQGNRGYRYWDYTRDGAGDLSVGHVVEVYSLNGDDSHSYGSVDCHGAIASRHVPALPLGVAGAALLALSLRVRRFIRPIGLDSS